MACTAFIGLGFEETIPASHFSTDGCEFPACCAEWTVENSGSGDFDEPHPNNERDRVCCHLELRTGFCRGRWYRCRVAEDLFALIENWTKVNARRRKRGIVD